MRNEGVATGNLTLHLLDSALGHAIQTWQFRDCEQVSIGRAPENDISLTDTQVSRLHAELIYRDGKWLLRSHGRNGTRVGGELITQVRLKDRSTFQLGPSGPTFQFVTVVDSASILQTIENFDPAALEFLEIDETRQAEEVNRIVESESFRELQEQARRLRGEIENKVQQSES